MIILRNQLEQHLWQTLLALRARGTVDGSVKPTPWVQPDDVVKISRAELKDQGVLSVYGIEKRFLPALLTREWIAVSTLHRMAKEGLLVTRERVTWGNLDRVVSDRYPKDTPEFTTCRDAFRTALNYADQRDRTQNVRDESIHVYHGHNTEFDMDPECKCLRQKILVPEGIVPAPIPGQGPRGKPTGGTVPGTGGTDPVPA